MRLRRREDRIRRVSALALSAKSWSRIGHREREGTTSSTSFTNPHRFGGGVPRGRRASTKRTTPGLSGRAKMPSVSTCSSQICQSRRRSTRRRRRAGWSGTWLKAPRGSGTSQRSRPALPGASREVPASGRWPSTSGPRRAAPSRKRGVKRHSTRMHGLGRGLARMPPVGSHVNGRRRTAPVSRSGRTQSSSTQPARRSRGRRRKVASRPRRPARGPPAATPTRAGSRARP